MVITFQLWYLSFIFAWKKINQTGSFLLMMLHKNIFHLICFLRILLSTLNRMLMSFEIKKKKNLRLFFFFFWVVLTFCMLFTKGTVLNSNKKLLILICMHFWFNKIISSSFYILEVIVPFVYFPMLSKILNVQQTIMICGVWLHVCFEISFCVCYSSEERE